MASLLVVEPGMFTTVQDLGREGWSDCGVPGGGAADSLALRVGNRLLSNDDGAPALEMTMTGGAFLFEDDARVALTGGELDATIERQSEPLRAENPRVEFRLRAGDLLRTGPIKRGVRAYLCIGGGFDVPIVLASASTYVACGFGGYHGRALRAGDRLVFHGGTAFPNGSALGEAARALLTQTLEQRALRAVAGAHSALFETAARHRFWNSTFHVSVQSDRMGVRLEEEPIPSPTAGRMASEAMPCGAVQVPANGQPIVLMPDRPTTGGYPVIACVATVDLPVLGQLRPRDAVRFQQVTLDEARRLYHEREQQLAIMAPRTFHDQAEPT